MLVQKHAHKLQYATNGTAWECVGKEQTATMAMGTIICNWRGGRKCALSTPSKASNPAYPVHCQTPLLVQNLLLLLRPMLHQLILSTVCSSPSCFCRRSGKANCPPPTVLVLKVVEMKQLLFA